MAGTLTKLNASEYLVDGEALAATDLAAEGTSGQVLMSNGKVTKPSYQTVDVNTGFLLLDTQEAESSATIDFTGLDDTYSLYKVVGFQINSASDDQILTFRTSADNGVTFDSGATDYTYNVIGRSTDGSTLHSYSGGATSAHLTNTGVGWGFGTGSTNEEGDFELTLFNPSLVTYTKFHSTVNYIGANANTSLALANGSRRTAAAVDAIRFLFGSGNIASGTFKLYGLK